ncbi:MAG: phosphatase PAP2 family protein [Actinomycetota bacterium]|nr:phosphatase PAP2 family protein [Actinomycetota bacterium]
MTTPLLQDASTAFSHTPARTRRMSLLALASLIILTSSAALVLLARYAIGTASGQRLDADAMDSVDGSSATMVALLDGLGWISIGTAAAALALCVTLAVLRRRYAHALGAVVLVAGSNVTAQVLKYQVFDRPDLGVGYVVPNSLPSGHTTMVASLVLAALLVAPRAFRAPLAALGTAATVIAGAATVVADWHRPSDVLAALLVPLAWGTLVVLVLGWNNSDAPVRSGSVRTMHGVVAIVGAALAGVLLIGVGVRPDSGWADLELAAWMLGGIGVTGAACVGIFARLSASYAP